MKSKKLSKFNDTFSGSLDIELSEEPTPISEKLYNVSAPPTAKIKSIKFQPSIMKDDDFVNPTKKDLAEIIIVAPTITINSRGGSATFNAPNGKHFTAGDLIVVIEESERQTRGNTEWFGGIDVHHVYFEGLVPDKNGYTIYWGS
jgi:hypothetical protein